MQAMKQSNLFHYMYKVITFALPISAAGVINMISGFIAMMMVASLGKEQLAAGALAIPTFITMMTVTATIFYAVGILISYQRGQDKTQIEIGLIVKNGFFLAVLLSFPTALGLWYIDKFLLIIGQNAQLVIYATGYFHYAALNMLPMLVNIVISQFYAGTGKPHFTLWIAVISFPLTLLMAYGFILGHFGLPRLGLSGITCASLIVQSLMMIVMLSIIYWHEKTGIASYQLFNKLSHPNWSICKSIFTLGMPIGIQFGGELAAMTAASYLMGYFGASALAASQIVSQYTMIVIVLIIGLTQALSLLISEAYGRRDYFLVKEYFKAAMTILVLCTFTISIIFLAFPKELIQFYISQGKSDIRLEYLSIVFFAISAGLIFIDGFRHLLSGALRGLHDSRAPMRIGIIAMWLVSLPISYLIGIICHGGPIGLRIGFVSGFILAAILLFLRIRKKLYLTKLNED
jgi:multidrug resistance protein, MATE family